MVFLGRRSACETGDDLFELLSNRTCHVAQPVLERVQLYPATNTFLEGEVLHDRHNEPMMQDLCRVKTWG